MENPGAFKAGLTPHSTWKVQQEAYDSLLGKVEARIETKAAEAEYKALLGFKTASKEFQYYMGEAKKALDAGDTAGAKNYLASAQWKKSALEAKKKAAQTKKSVSSTAMGKSESFTDMDKSEIDRLLQEYRSETMNDADNRLRPLAEDIWKNKLTKEERLVLTKYTQTYCYLNEPLRGLTYTGARPKSEYIHDLPILTSALSKFEMPQNTVVRRGVANYKLKDLGYDLSGLKKGDEFVDKGFLSTATHHSKGFFDDYNLVICVPKGAKGFYAEPFSHYTDNQKFDYKTNSIWDGVSKETIKKEAEWIGQRGSKFRVLKKKGNTIYLQLIGQLQ